MGVAYGVWDPAISKIYSTLLSDNVVILGWSAYNALWYGAFGLSAIIGSYIAHMYGFYIVFIVMSSIVAVSLFLSLFVKSDKGVGCAN